MTNLPLITKDIGHLYGLGVVNLLQKRPKYVLNMPKKLVKQLFYGFLKKNCKMIRLKSPLDLTPISITCAI